MKEVVIVIRGGCLVDVISNADVVVELIDLDSIEREGEEAVKDAEDRLMALDEEPEYESIW